MWAWSKAFKGWTWESMAELAESIWELGVAPNLEPGHTTHCCSLGLALLITRQDMLTTRLCPYTISIKEEHTCLVTRQVFYLPTTAELRDLRPKYWCLFWGPALCIHVLRTGMLLGWPRDAFSDTVLIFSPSRFGGGGPTTMNESIIGDARVGLWVIAHLSSQLELVSSWVCCSRNLFPLKHL